jgi:myo-inositol-1(or 4)-monophosphatase
MNKIYALDNYLSTAVRAAKVAGMVQKERLWTGCAIDFKGETNLVTEVDRKCEELIVETVRSDFPESDILAEENIYESMGSPVKWIIDPLDGTTNYAHGFPWFCVSIALEIEGDLKLGAIFHPMMDELFTVIKGEGARLNGKELRVSGNHPLRSCLLATGFPYDRTRENENNFGNFVKFQLSARGIRRAGSAALDLAYVAAGRLDGYWESKLNPWDVAAGTLLVAEAGGRVSDFAGNRYSIYTPRIVASNGHVHEEMVTILNREKENFPMNEL